MAIECAAQFDRLAAFGDNWDGYGAKPLNPKLLSTARTLLKSIADEPPPKIVPLSGGGVQFEWNKGRRSFEIGIEDEYEFDYLKYEIGICADTGTISLGDTELIRSLITWATA